MEFRRAGKEDIQAIIHFRKLQLKDEGQTADTHPEEQMKAFFETKMDQDTFAEWFACNDEGKIIATAGILFLELPPSFSSLDTRRGYITNMYTADAYRGQGIAGRLIGKLEEEAKEKGVGKLMLHASEMGRKAYRKVGFQEYDIVMEKELF